MHDRDIAEPCHDQCLRIVVSVELLANNVFIGVK